MTEAAKRVWTTLGSGLQRITKSFLSPSSKSASSEILTQKRLNSQQKASELYELGMKSFRDVERNLEITDLGDFRLKPKIEKARTSFTLALAYDPENLDAALALSKIHLKFGGPGCSLISGVSLLFHAADNGSSEAAYDVFCRLRADEYLPGVEFDDQTAIKYLKKAAEQGHSDALFSLGVHYLTEENNLELAKSCFTQSANQGNSASAMVLGAILVREGNGELIHENVSAMLEKQPQGRDVIDSKSQAKHYLDMAASNGEDLAFEWLLKEKNSG